MDKSITLLPIFESIQLAWQKVRGSKRIFWINFGLYFLLDVFETILYYFLTLKMGIIINLTLIFFWYVAAFFQVLLIWQYLYIGILRAADKHIAFVSSFYHVFNGKLILNVIGLYIILFLLIFIPSATILVLLDFLYTNNLVHGVLFNIFTMLCIALAFFLFVFFIIRTSLSHAVCITQNVTPFKAIATSFKTTQHNFFRLILISMLNIIIFLVSSFPFGIGLIWGFPYILIHYGMIYKILVTPMTKSS